eukprot:COSAG01_NODE_63152_length_281_cov_0.785714_1_plen_52_part_00
MNCLVALLPYIVVPVVPPVGLAKRVSGALQAGACAGSSLVTLLLAASAAIY